MKGNPDKKRRKFTALFTAVLAGLFVILSGVSVFSEESGEIPSYSFDPSEASYAGEWVDFPANFEIYMPQGWVVRSLTASEQEEGYLYSAVSPHGKYNIFVSETVLDTPCTSNDIVSQLNEQQLSGVKKVKVNGITAVVSSIKMQDVNIAALSFLSYTGKYLYTIAAGPFDRDFSTVAQEILISVRPLP